MAAPYNPPVKGEDFIIYIALEDSSSPGNFKVNPTIAAGDFRISKDGGTLNNLNTLPSVLPASSIWVKITISATEMDADNVAVQGIDQTSPKEWGDWALSIPTT